MIMTPSPGQGYPGLLAGESGAYRSEALPPPLGGTNVVVTLGETKGQVSLGAAVLHAAVGTGCGLRSPPELKMDLAL